MSKFCDLNLNGTNLSSKDLNQLIEFALKLGYDNLAISKEFEFPVVKKKEGKADQRRQQVTFPAPVDYKLPENLANQLKRSCRKVVILNRINLKLNEADISTNLHHLRSKDLQKFDIVAVTPANNNVLMYMCTNNYSIDIISIDSGISCGLTDQHLVKPLRNAIESFGISFELNYSPALCNSINRKDFIMLGRSLAFNTKSKSLILSSNATDPMQLRAPNDLLIIAKLFDINNEQTHKLVRYSPFNTMLKSFCRQHTAAGIVYFNESKDVEKFKKVLLLMKSQTSEKVKILEDEEMFEDNETENDKTINIQDNNKASKRKLDD